MRRLLSYVLLAAGLTAVGYFSQHPEKLSTKSLGLDNLPGLGGSSSLGWSSSTETPAPADGEKVRIATFNIQVFGTAKLKKRDVTELLAQVVRRFDVVAIQEIRSNDANLLPEFLEIVNAPGRRYDYVIGPRLGRSDSKEQYAFVFDTDRIEIDRSAVYTVDDPDDLLHREPMVAPFRVRGPPENEAFTFTLVDIHTDPDEVGHEINVLDDVFTAVRNDGRGEDDIILLGDLNADDYHYGELGALPNIMWALAQTPTNTRRTHMYDNLLFDRLATTEFDGRSGVLDLQSELKLTVDQALQLSDHCPVWAEFSVYEAGRAGPLASRPGAPPR